MFVRCSFSRSSRALAILFAVNLLGHIVYAVAAYGQQTFDWTNDAGINNFWDVATNWDNSTDPSGPVPGVADTANFSLVNGVEVLFDNSTGDWDLDRLEVTDGDVLFSVNSAGLRTLTTNEFFVSESNFTLGNGLTWDNLATSEIVEGGQLKLGQGSMWTTEALSIGRFDPNSGGPGASPAGVLIVENGGKFDSQSAIVGDGLWSTGNVVVSGTGSQWQVSQQLIVGLSGNSDLRIDGGGVVTSGSGVVGFRSDTLVNKVTVTGLGSRWDNSSTLVVGSEGGAELAISDGAVVSNTRGIVGGLVTVSDAGSQWNNSGELQVGFFMSGDLRIQNGGVVSSAGGFIGATETSLSSTVAVAGEGSQWISNGELAVGGFDSISSDNSLNLSDNGSVNVNGWLSILNNNVVDLSTGAAITSDQVVNSGSINATSGSVDIHGAVRNSAIGTINIGQAEVTFHDDVFMNSANRNIQNEGSVTIEGSYNGGSDGDGELKVGGVFTVGGSDPVVITVGGDLWFQESTDAVFEIGGLLEGEFDQVLVGGDLILDGALLLKLATDFELTIGDEFLIMDVAADLLGTFEGLAEGDLVRNFGGIGLYVSYAGGDGNDVSLFAAFAVPEPNSVVVLGLLTIGLSVRRKRDRTSAAA